MSIKLEIGKNYVCRNGAVVGPLEKNPAEGSHYKFKYNGISWSKDGVWSIGCEDGKDIVAEYHEYVWKWMVPDKPGVWMSGGSKRKSPDMNRVIAVHIMSEWLEGWYCFLMDIPSIQMPPKQRVTKRLWLKEVKVLPPVSGCSVYEQKWESNDIVPEGWISTNVTKEFEE